jgi:hypothetical protein
MLSVILAPVISAPSKIRVENTFGHFCPNNQNNQLRQLFSSRNTVESIDL